MRAFLLCCVSSLLVSASAWAQSAPPPGVRAAGMGGAFTAVADDASAVFWNPAGLASGSFFSLVLDRNTADDASTPPLGLSYYRTAIEDRADGRNSLVAHHAGATILQSVGGRLAVGATLKLVHGVVGSDPGGSVSTNKFDMDVGVMATGALGRVGLSVHNLTEPEFKGPLSAVTLERRIRGGVAVNAGGATVVAADMDFKGEGREAAVGVEMRPARSAWVRSGIHWNVGDGERAPVGSVGGSYAVYGSTVVDAQVSFGSEKGRRGWGVGLRFVF